MVTGVVEAAECCMARWHKDEAEGSWPRHAAEDAKSDDKGRGVGSCTDTAVDECRNDGRSCGKLPVRLRSGT